MHSSGETAVSSDYSIPPFCFHLHNNNGRKFCPKGTRKNKSRSAQHLLFNDKETLQNFDKMSRWEKKVYSSLEYRELNHQQDHHHEKNTVLPAKKDEWWRRRRRKVSKRLIIVFFASILHHRRNNSWRVNGVLDHKPPLQSQSHLCGEHSSMSSILKMGTKGKYEWENLLWFLGNESKLMMKQAIIMMTKSLSVHIVLKGSFDW